MKKYLVILVLLANLVNSVNAEETVKIGKQNIKLDSNLMTPEALWAMGRIGAAEASADGKQIVYQVGYYSVTANKSQQEIAVINADGTNNTTLTTGTKSETDPTWYQGKIAFLSGGQIWTMNADGTDRKQISKTSKDIEGFQFSPDGKKVILLHSIDFHEIIKKNPDDLPKATGRLVTDLMYRHWDHYVESIQHPFVTDVTIENGELKIQRWISWRVNLTSARWNLSEVWSNSPGVLTPRPSLTLVVRRREWPMPSLQILISIYII